MSLLENDNPVRIYKDPVNQINIFPNQLLSAVVKPDLSPKTFNISITTKIN